MPKFNAVTLSVPEGTNVAVEPEEDDLKDRIYVKFGLYDIRIVKTDEGVVVDIYSSNPQGDGESVASAYAFDSDVAYDPEEIIRSLGV